MTTSYRTPRGLVSGRTRAYVTLTGRCYHSTPSCPGVISGQLNSADPAIIRRTVGTALREGLRTCLRCWN